MTAMDDGNRAVQLRTVAEVADVLRVSTMTVYRLIRSGDLPALRVGKNYRVRQQDLHDYLSAGVVHAERSNG
ncbi:helix-turn-helix domain-containing protein [Egicoccus sp. AB-alg2]|uniref:helix-turn-helix domain-containing protein n=1 Tax=Egicoccus sp. AB-alg2 TaxID=3242693 RepID=UPI00359D17DA